LKIDAAAELIELVMPPQVSTHSPAATNADAPR
jgi:hypothetical protein